jgi:hypothetical protein
MSIFSRIQNILAVTWNTWRVRATHPKVRFSDMNAEEQRTYLQREAKEFIRRYGRVIDALAKE